MAAASYTTDLTSGVITACDSGTFTEFTGWTAGTLSTVPETDYYIQGSGCVSSSAKTTQNSIAFNYGSGVTVPTDGAVFFWQTFFAPQSLGTWAQGGQRCVIGTSVSVFNMWYSGGSDVTPNPYGGWRNIAIDPTVTPDATAGTVTTLQYFGIICYLPSTAPGKGAPFGLDAIRYGRGDYRVNGGDVTNGYATFAGMATENDNSSNRWGLFSYQSGSYIWKGLMTLGYSSAIDFRDANKAIVIDDCPRVGANFNKIEIRQATSRVDWTNIVFDSLGATSSLGTVAKGRFEMIDAADVNILGCLFKGMDTFVFLSSGSIISTSFLNCRQITHGGADFDSCIFSGYEGTADTGYLLYNVNADPDGEMDNCSFTKGTAATHAIQFGTNTPSTITLRGLIFSGYNASNGNNDSTLYFPDKGSDTTWTVNLVSCSGNISYKKARTGDTVNLVINPVTIGVTVKDLVTGNVITSQDVRVFVAVASGINYPYNASVTIVNSSTTATVTHTGHGLVTNDKVWIKGASHYQNNGVFTITKITDDSYSYTMSSAPGSNPTGTITSTFVPIEGLTNASGYISASKSYSSDQPVTGWARKSSGTPLYKTGAISGDIDNVAGVQLTVLLAKDE